MKPEIVQFAFKNGTPETGMIVDCRQLPNPFRRGWTDEALREKVRNTPGFENLVQLGVQLLARHNRIQVGCTHGRHRSVAVAEEIAKRTGATIRSVV